MENELILVANPGSASRKYALFAGEQPLAELHFEIENSRPICTLETAEGQRRVEIQLTSVEDAVDELVPLLQRNNILQHDAVISRIGLRVVAPSRYFLQDHVINDDFVNQLEAMSSRAPLHIEAALQELRKLHAAFPQTHIIGVSDSAFHVRKPEHAWNYGLPIADADRLEIKRFGYHGISAASAVRVLRQAGKLPPKLILCHLGSGASVMAILNGESQDSTMGYSPLEGLIMATRVGSIDPTAARVLKDEHRFDDARLDDYLNRESGLLGLSGTSSDIRELIISEANGDGHARLALETYIYNVQKAIGQMSAVLGGADMLVFTGTVGERSAVIREHVIKPFLYLEFSLDSRANERCTSPEELTRISEVGKSKPIFVVPTDEATEIAMHVRNS